MMTSDIDSGDRIQRFVTGYEERLKKLIASDDLILPQHKWSSDISFEEIRSISGTKKQDIGHPVLYCPSRSDPLVITSTGLFFASTWGTDLTSQRGNIYWHELDIVAGPDLQADERAVTTRFDGAQLRAKVPISISVITYAVYVILQSLSAPSGFINYIAYSFWILFLVIASPIGVFLFHKVVQWVGTSLFCAFTRGHRNLLIIGARQVVDLGFRQRADDLAEAIMLGLMIYRRQCEKYGPQT